MLNTGIIIRDTDRTIEWNGHTGVGTHGLYRRRRRNRVNRYVVDRIYSNTECPADRAAIQVADVKCKAVSVRFATVVGIGDTMMVQIILSEGII